VSRFSRWWPPALWAAAIFFLSSQSRLPVPPGPFGWDKLQHFLGYAPGGFVLARALARRERGMIPIALLLGSLYGMSDEVHQYFVPGRNSDWHDWVADTLGVLLGIIIYRMVVHQWRARRGTAERAEAMGT